MKPTRTLKSLADLDVDSKGKIIAASQTPAPSQPQKPTETPQAFLSPPGGAEQINSRQGSHHWGINE